MDNIASYIIYTICGITDILDGYIARKTKTESKSGSKLDSIADLFFGVVIIKLIFLYAYFMNNITIFYIVCLVATVTAIEEMCINIKSTKLEINKKIILNI